MPDDLHAQLRAAVEARLATARAATPGPWFWDQTPSNGWGEGEQEPVLNSSTDPEPYEDGGQTRWSYKSVVSAWGHDAWGVIVEDADAAHIAANDPATVERQCLADLRRLERHGYDPDTGRCFECMEWCDCADETPVRDCPCRGNRPHPCPEIRDLAAAYGLDIPGQDGESGADVTPPAP